MRVGIRVFKEGGLGCTSPVFFTTPNGGIHATYGTIKLIFKQNEKKNLWNKEP